jgi:transcriptional regulator with XRE-family HTH domain
MIKESLLVVIGKNLRRIRKEKGMSIERLALISAVNKNYISDLERGNRNPTIMMLDRLAFSLEIEVKELFE